MKSVRKITTINICKIPCYCNIGIDSQEKKLGQKLLIDVHLDISSFRAISTDDVKDTVSYVDVYKAIQEIAKKPYSLIEALAEEIANTFLKHPIILKARVVVHKPHIPYKDFYGDVSVEVTREKQNS